MGFFDFFKKPKRKAIEVNKETKKNSDISNSKAFSNCLEIITVLSHEDKKVISEYLALKDKEKNAEGYFCTMGDILRYNEYTAFIDWKVGIEETVYNLNFLNKKLNLNLDLDFENMNIEEDIRIDKFGKELEAYIFKQSKLIFGCIDMLSDSYDLILVSEADFEKIYHLAKEIGMRIDKLYLM